MACQPQFSLVQARSMVDRGCCFAEDVCVWVCVRMLMCNLSLYGPSLMPSLRRSHGGGGGGGFFIQWCRDRYSLPPLTPLTLMCQLEGRSRPGDASERGWISRRGEYRVTVNHDSNFGKLNSTKHQACTLLQRESQVTLEMPAEIPVGHEILV